MYVCRSPPPSSPNELTEPGFSLLAPHPHSTRRPPHPRLLIFHFVIEFPLGQMQSALLPFSITHLTKLSMKRAPGFQQEDN